MRIISFRSLWEGLPLQEEKELVLRLAYFDRCLNWLIIMLYPVCFSGVGIFQVKYDGQLKIDEDEHSLACDFHCLRVEKSNSGKLEPKSIK